MFRMLFASAAALVLSASAHAAPEKVYLISYDLFDGDHRIGSPRLILTEDRAETVTVAGPQGYVIRAMLTTNTDVTQPIAVLSSEISLPGEGGWVKIAAPIMAIPFGEAARFEVMRKDRPGARFRMDVTVSE